MTLRVKETGVKSEIYPLQLIPAVGFKYPEVQKKILPKIREKSPSDQSGPYRSNGPWMPETAVSVVTIDDDSGENIPHQRTCRGRRGRSQ